MTESSSAEAPRGDSTARKRIVVRRDGPYQPDPGIAIVDHLGVPVTAEAPVRLCRCGQSQTRPFCDDSHVRRGFTGAKDLRRVPDKLDIYAGQQAHVFDNRGICAHSAFCTDRLQSVFHLGEEPFIAPSGARLDDLINAVRRCPSGALGIGIGPARDADLSDIDRPPQIEVSKDGPYRITGAIELVDEDGAPIARNAGASHEHASLCRCGASLNKPFCSGMHWSVGFRDPVPDPAREPTLFEWAGGYPALLDMTRIFYSRYVPEDPLLGPLFAEMSPDHPERVAAWLSEVFGGPRLYTERYGGYQRMVSQHIGKEIRPEQRALWATYMVQSADDAGLPSDPEFRAAFVAYIEWGSRIAVENSAHGAQPPPNMPVPRWWWVCNATPGARPAASGDEIPAVGDAGPAMPGPGEAVRFEQHIRPLFRPMDRNSMLFAFDLWNEEHVRAHRRQILARLQAGTMPCDGAWPPERIALFERWADAPS
ncbi:CDGSH iron-sulfur domain-containing protein [Bradyrhizobium tropiciagri]|uniref:CDGSH iron-sulfur domain-containing protein n=1 Tax=Bradyrhizobium tropiciagri TaxID=312253 RepID=UPI001BA779E4|nr:CDGSH iron-sulfur domain-containing protein [Bradyrhizobium tropiciagri]MBR0870009.1 CDGSH iron-sulfur domain-containing protein [Bradyrhizobium tropiciagri]